MAVDGLERGSVYVSEFSPVQSCPWCRFYDYHLHFRKCKVIVSIIVVLVRGIRLFDFYRDYHPFLIRGPLRHPIHTN